MESDAEAMAKSGSSFDLIIDTVPVRHDRNPCLPLLDFCARRNVLPDCEMIRMDEINQAFERMERSDVGYRFVIDMSSLS